MKIAKKNLMLGACAVLALTACGKKDSDAAEAGGKAMSEASVKMSASELDKPFTMKGAEPLDVDAFVAGMGAEGALVYDSSDFDKNKGATVLTNVRMAGEQSPFTIGKMELYGVNTDTIDQLKSGADMDKLGEVFRKIRLYDLDATFPMEGTDGMGTISVDALDVDKLMVRKPAEGEDMDEGKSFAAGAKSMSLGGISMKGFDMSVAGAPEIGDVTISADDFRIASYSDGKFGGMKMAGVDYTIVQDDAAIAQTAQAFGPASDMILNSPLKNILFPAQQSGSIGSMAWDGLSFDGLLGYLEKGEKPPVTAKNLLSVGGMTFLNTTQDINGKRASSVKKVTISPIEFEHFMPKSIKMVSEGEKYDMTALVGDDYPEVVSILEKNGLDDITGHSKMNYAYSSKNNTITMDMNSVAKGFMDSEFDLKVGNFDYAKIAAGEEDAEAAVMDVTIEGMTLKLDDEKFVDTAFAIAGQVMEQDPAQLRQQAVGLISLGSLQGAAISPRVPNYATALSTFISEGGTLEIKVDPETPATVAAIAAAGEANPGGVLDTLNLTVSQSK